MLRRGMDANFWAFFVYLIGSIGYLIGDGFAMFNFPISDTASDSLFTALAALFFVNSVQYFFIWMIWSKRRPDIECWAEIINMLASLLYVVSAFLFFLYPIDTQTLTSRAHATVQSGLNFAAVMLFAVDALMYNSGFALRRHRARKKSDDQEEEPLFRSFEFFAELFNTIPSLGYFVTGMIQFFRLVPRKMFIKRCRVLCQIAVRCPQSVCFIHCFLCEVC